MRTYLKDQEVGLDPYFRYRGKNQTRVETFSDAAFALAITLIVLSSTVPKTFDELWLSMRQVVPFGFCVVLVMVIWYQHYIHFLRYGLQNMGIIFLNTMLIFLILIYVYPLKFLFVILFDLYVAIFSSDQQGIEILFTEVIAIEDTRALMIIYGLGAAFIFLILALMYRLAYRLKKELDLDEYEIFETRRSMKLNFLMASIPLFSALIAISGIFGQHNFTFSGFAYLLYPPVMITYSSISKKRSKALVSRLRLDQGKND